MIRLCSGFVHRPRHAPRDNICALLWACISLPSVSKSPWSDTPAATLTRPWHSNWWKIHHLKQLQKPVNTQEIRLGGGSAEQSYMRLTNPLLGKNYIKHELKPGFERSEAHAVLGLSPTSLQTICKHSWSDLWDLQPPPLSGVHAEHLGSRPLYNNRQLITFKLLITPFAAFSFMDVHLLPHVRSWEMLVSYQYC